MLHIDTIPRKLLNCSGGEFEAASTTAVAARKRTGMVLGERLQVLQQNVVS
jgi:hypothetical protein